MTLYTDTIKTLVQKFPGVVPHLSREARLMAGIKANLQNVNKEYHDLITQSIVDYFEGGSVSALRNDFKRAMIQAFGDSFDAGWIDGGGELPIDDDAMIWLETRLNEETANIDGVFEQAKQLRKDKEFDYFAWATARADGYTNTLSFIYNAAKMLADEKQMLTWNLGNTEKHCETCQKLDGKRHRASWYLERDYVPRKPGAAMDCQGYNCDCTLTNDKGEEVTI